MQKLGIRSINHVYHEVNQCEDGMTNFVTEVEGNSCLAFNECPTEVVGKFLDDNMGVPYPLVIFVTLISINASVIYHKNKEMDERDRGDKVNINHPM